MKRFLLVSLCLLAVLFGKVDNLAAQDITGNPAEDAISFNKFLTTDQKKVFQMLSYYFDTPVDNATEAKRLLDSNPFLKKYSSSPILTIQALDGGGPGIQPTGSGGLGGLNVANYADALAKFLIERGRRELSTVFFDRFNRDLKKFPELAYLFPKTTDILVHIDNANVLNLLQELKDAFIKDLLSMPKNILSLRKIDTTGCAGNIGCVARITNIQAKFSGSNSAVVIIPLVIMQEMIDGKNIIEISEDIVIDESVYNKADDVSGYFQFASILLQSIRSNGEEVFIKPAMLKEIFASSDKLNIYLGFTYQKFYKKPGYANLSINSNKLVDILRKVQTNSTKAFALLSASGKVNTWYLSVKKQVESGKPVDGAAFASFVGVSADFIPQIVSWVNTNVNGDIKLPAEYKTIENCLLLTEDIVNGIQQKNYAGIFNATIGFIEKQKLLDNSPTHEKLIKYLAFGANLASASNSDEIKNAVETVALPAGSFSVKQKSTFNISLNGYIGYGWDYSGGSVYAKGIYAPIGISISTRLSKTWGGAITAFGSLIDIGGVVSYRLENGTTDPLKQEIRLESIVSPSAQVMLAIPKTPITFCYGWRMTPKLFYSSTTSFQAVPAKSVSNFSILIDIPIFTLFNSGL